MLPLLKLLSRITILLCLGLPLLPAGLEAQTFSAMTYNIRFDNPGDGDNRWDNRKAQLREQVKWLRPDFLGIQEGLKRQVDYLDRGLEGYDYVGVGRDDGDTLGEYSALFYRGDRFELLQNGTFWLSEEPDRPSVGWDAAMERICSWGQFRHRKSGKMIWVFNTHFDHVGAEARARSARLILGRIRQWALSADEPALLMGDLNAVPGAPPIEKLEASLLDSRGNASGSVFGPEATWNAFDPRNSSDRRIDYIFHTTDLRSIHYATLSPLIEGRFLSDHFPVMVQLEWE